MNRRGFLQGLLAGVAIATGLARTELERPGPKKLAGLDVAFYPDQGVFAWWHGEALATSPDGVTWSSRQVHETMERLWRECCKPSTPTPDVIWIGTDEQLESLTHAINRGNAA